MRIALIAAASLLSGCMSMPDLAGSTAAPTFTGRDPALGYRAPDNQCRSFGRVAVVRSVNDRGEALTFDCAAL